MELCDVQAGSFVRGKTHRDKEEFLAISFRGEVPEAELLCTSLLFTDGKDVLVSPIEFGPHHCGSTTNVVLRSERCGCQRELLVSLVFSRTPALLPLPPTAPSATGMSPSCVRRSPRSGPSASMLSNRSHVSSDGRFINCLAEAKLLCHLTLMHLPSISFSTTRCTGSYCVR